MSENALKSKATEELLRIWVEHDHNTHSPAELGAVFELLLNRGIEIPPPRITGGEENRPKARRLPVETNAVLRILAPGKAEIRFPKKGFLRPGKFEFKDQDDRLNYLSQTFELSQKEGGIVGSLTRKGKYQRVDENDNPIFTFGDPILDLTTNRYGLTIIGDEIHDLYSETLKSRIRRGGIQSIELDSYMEEMRRTQVVNAALGNGSFMLLDCDGTSAKLAESNPSVLDFWSGSAHLRFRAWRTNLGIYFSLGAEIETWNSDFTFALINGKYGEHLPTGTGTISSK